MKSLSSNPHLASISPTTADKNYLDLIFRFLGSSSQTIPILIVISLCPVVMLAQLKNETTVARVNGQTISLEELDGIATSQTFALKQQLYAIRKTALDNLIVSKLLEAEAKKHGVSVASLRQGFMAGPVTVSWEEINEVYRQNASAFGLLSQDEAREKIRLDLEGQVRLRKYREALLRLRQSAEIQWLLEEPRLLVRNPEDDTYSLGSNDAAIVITEFLDFQCPYCREAQPILKKLLGSYPGKLRIDFRNLPLPIHPLAGRAAQAAYCAGKQGAFWPYHDALLETEVLTIDHFDQIGSRLRLKNEPFQKCLSDPDSRSAVLADLEEARELGINGTPSFVVNGKLLNGLVSFEEFKRVIERELQSTLNHPHLQSPQPLSQKEQKQ